MLLWFGSNKDKNPKASKPKLVMCTMPESFLCSILWGSWQCDCSPQLVNTCLCTSWSLAKSSSNQIPKRRPNVSFSSIFIIILYKFWYTIYLPFLQLNLLQFDEYPYPNCILLPCVHFVKVFSFDNLSNKIL